MEGRPIKRMYGLESGSTGQPIADAWGVNGPVTCVSRAGNTHWSEHEPPTHPTAHHNDQGPAFSTTVSRVEKIRKLHTCTHLSCRLIRRQG